MLSAGYVRTRSRHLVAPCLVAALLVGWRGVSVAGGAPSAPTPSQAVRDFWLGAQLHDAARFCRSIVGRAQDGRIVRISQTGCEADFRAGAFEGALGGARFVRTGAVTRRG